MGLVGNLSESVAASDMTCSAVRAKGVYVLPFLDLLIALVNGSHGMRFVHKTVLVILLLIGDITLL